MPPIKDRQSRMICSSVHASAKKDGSGGSYTWGSAADDPTDLVSASSAVVGSYIATAADSAATSAPQAEPFQGDLMNEMQFPTLSGNRTMTQQSASRAEQVPMTVAQSSNSQIEQVPLTMTDAAATEATEATQKILTENQLRPGTADLFNSSHPRNAFASKPTKPTTMVMQNPGLQMAIDWSSSGIPSEVNRCLIKAGNSSHLGLYQQASASRVPRQYLRSAAAPVHVNLSHRIQAQGKPPMVKQMHAKGSRGQCP